MGLTFTNKRRRRWPVVVAILVVVLAVGAGAAVFIANRDSGPPPLPAAEVDAFLRAWQQNDDFAMAKLLDAPPKDLDTTAFSLVKAVPGSKATYTRTALERTGTKSPATASARYHASVALGGLGAIAWDGTMAVVRDPKAKVWRITWKPDLLYPGLKTGQHLGFQRTWPARASIIAGDGSILAGNQGVITIGIEPRRVTKSLPQIKTLMQSLVGTDPASIDAALHAPGVQPNFFVPIATVPDDARYTTVIRPQLYPVIGVTFHRDKGVLTTSANLAPIVGKVGEITAEKLKELGAPYRVGDRVGLSGLQAAYEKRLAGAPSADVVVLAGAKKVRTVKHFAGTKPLGVTLTIDPRTQAAADAALAGVTQPAAIVAVDTTNGQMRAVVSKPDGGYNRALAGTYPPGSTFKVVSSAALLTAGRTATTPAPCPAALTVNGRVFHNFEGEAPGSLDLAKAFQISCNNAFIGLGDQLPLDALGKTAALFGFNAKWSLPIQSFGGSYPTPKDRVELGASAIGQARVVASPAQMASVAATVASGQWHAPVLTTEPAPTVPKVGPLPANVAATLRTFMASVVQGEGTAAGAGLPAGTLGKTGTAEFGTADPPHTHAWFVGYRGNLAFAVIVEDGGVGGRVAAPLAAKFLNALG